MKRVHRRRLPEVKTGGLDMEEWRVDYLFSRVGCGLPGSGFWSWGVEQNS